MATVNELKATARPKAGKGAARAVRRAGRVPGVIYGDTRSPSRSRSTSRNSSSSIYAGHFLTTIYDLEVDGTKHRVIPRDFQLDPVRTIRSMSISCASARARRSACAFRSTSIERRPGARRQARRHGQHRDPHDRVQCPGRRHPAGLRRRHHRARDQLFASHLSDIKLPPNVQRARARRHHAGHHRAAVRLRRRNEGRGRSGRCRCRGCRSGCGRSCRLRRPARPGAAPRGCARRRLRRPRRSKAQRLFAVPARAVDAVGDRIASRCVHAALRRARQSGRQARGQPPQHRLHGGGGDRQAPRLSAVAAPLPGRRDRRHDRRREACCCCCPGTYMNESGRAVAEALHFYKLALDRHRGVPRRDRACARQGAGEDRRRHRRATTACARSPRMSATTIGACASASVIRASRIWCMRYVLERFRQERAAVGRGAVRHHRRQRRAAGERQGRELPEQGASRDAAKGFGEPSREATAIRRDYGT